MLLMFVSDRHLDLVQRRHVESICRRHLDTTNVAVALRPVRLRDLALHPENESRPRRQADRKARGPGNPRRCGSESLLRRIKAHHTFYNFIASYLNFS